MTASTPRHVLDPFADIVKQPLLTPDGLSSSRCAVRLKDADAPAGWREVGIVGSEYTLVPNHDLLEMGRDLTSRLDLLCDVPVPVFDGRRFHLLLPFSPSAAADDYKGAAVGVRLTNSYDGSLGLAASLFVHIPARSTLLLCPSLFPRVRLRGSTASDTWESDAQRIVRTFSQATTGLETFAALAARLSEENMTPPHLEALRKGLLAEIPATLWARVLDGALLTGEHTLQGLMFTAGWETWKRGLPKVRMLGHNETFVQGLLTYAKRLR